MPTPHQRFELWCFLQAFQRSPYKYIRFRLLMDVLEEMTENSVDAVMHQIESHDPTSSDWLSSLLASAQAFKLSEEPFFRDSFNFIFYGEDHFPKYLCQMSDPPLALSYEGDLSKLSGFSLSVVGSREAHSFSYQWMQSELYEFLKKYRVPVISGGARGVDQRAHGLAQILGIPTGVVLPSGLAFKYPALWEEKAGSSDSLIFISEMALGDKISKRNFSSRNRLIASWSFATLIVEASSRSGTLMTAHHALSEGRPVWIVPGHPLMPSFSGALDLLVDQGQIVRNAFDMGRLFETETFFHLRKSLNMGSKMENNH
jgi:DNA processing protein